MKQRGYLLILLLSSFFIVGCASAVFQTQGKVSGLSFKDEEMLDFLERNYYKKFDRQKCIGLLLDGKKISDCTDRWTELLPAKESGTCGCVSNQGKLLDFRTIEQGIGYLKIVNFSSRIVPQGIIWALDNLRIKRMGVLILDLRNNPGGLVASVLDSIALFAPNPYRAIAYQKTRSFQPEIPEFPIARNDLPKEMVGYFAGLRVVVLVDKKTASGAEITAAWFKEEFNSPIVGEKTFGKGLAQTIVTLSDGSKFKITVAEYLIGEAKVKVDGIGVKPTVWVKGENAQLKKAIKIARSILKADD